MAAAGGGEVPRSWEEELASLVEDSGVRFAAAEGDVGMPGKVEGFTAFNGFRETAAPPEESLKDQMKGFAKASAELMHELGRSCWEIGRQSLQGMEESYAVKRLRGPMAVVAGRLRFLNEYLPEDRDPAHAWPVVIVVFLLAAAVLSVNSDRQALVHLPKKVYVHPPSAARIQLPDGRYLAYREQGVSSHRARFSMIAPHSFLSSRLAGIPGIKDSLLEEFGVRLISYDLPGFGESDPHPIRDLKSSALDILYLANASGVAEKFWVVGYSGGAKHAWAAIRHIPDSIAGALMLAPMGNPYDISLNKEEKHKTWAKWTTRRKFMYILARKFPYFLRYFYRRSFLSGTHAHPEKLLSVLLGKKDKVLLEDRVFKEFWERDMEESIRQGDTRPFIEETVLQVSNWGFSLSDIQVLRRPIPKGFLSWLKSFYSLEELEWTGFLGPIHVWQGMDDQVVPPAMTDFVRRVVPGATVHKLHGEGHFSYFYFCDECHRHILSTLFGTPRGPVEPHEEDEAPTEGVDTEEETCPEITSQD